MKSSRTDDAAADDAIAYHHTVFCQTGLPYRNPGVDVRRWERRNGDVSLEIEAGRRFNPRTEQWEDVTLPWGAKARLVVIYLNTQAVLTKSPEIETEKSLTAFVESLGLADKGKNMRMVREQLISLSTARIRMALPLGSRSDGAMGVRQLEGRFADELELWEPASPRQRAPWQRFVRLTAPYFEKLVEHAVPLDARAISALKGSAMALDVYTFAAQRLCRLPRKRLLRWGSLMSQFLPRDPSVDHFKRDLIKAVGAVLSVYPDARIESDDEERGLWLFPSAPPIRSRALVPKANPIAVPAGAFARTGTPIAG